MTSKPPPGMDSGPDGSWSYSAPDQGPNPTPARTTSLDPLSQRLLKATACLSALLILIVAFAWLHGGDEASLNPIAEAAVRTQEQPGSRIAMRGIYSLPSGGSMAMHGSGVYNAQTGRSRLTMELKMPGVVTPLHFDAVGDKQTMYMRSSVFIAELPPGDRWLKVQVGLGRSAQTSLASNSGSEGQLEMLRAAGGKVEDLGEETVRGVATTRYQGTVDLNRYADLLREEGKVTGAQEYEQVAKSIPTPIPVEAWLDDDGLVRRMRIVMEIPTATGAPPVKMDLTMEFFDFGITPQIDFPSASETFDSMSDRGSAKATPSNPEDSPVESAHNTTGLGPQSIPLPAGRWKATGRVIRVAPNVLTNQPPGTVLKRPWAFGKECHGTCKIVFARMTLYGRSVTSLARHGRFLTAKFPPVKVPCSYPRGSSYSRRRYGQSHDYYKLRWSSDGTRIHAIEYRLQTGCYKTTDPPDVTRWQATRAAP
jgi:hypothetical protein